jgi:hypothetical protein
VKIMMISIFYILSLIVMPVSADDKEKRIEASEVNIRNYEQFVGQLKSDLPAGTSLQDVKTYLSNHNISYGHVPQKGYIQFMLKKIYSAFFIFNTDLHVEIFVSEENGVSEIKSELIETGF